MVVTYLRSRAVCIHLLVFKKQGLEEIYNTKILKMVHRVTLGMMRTTPLAINYTNRMLIDEAIIGELKLYIEDWEKLIINNKSQLSCTMFFAKYGSLALYDEDMEKDLSLTTNNYNLINIQKGL